MFHVKQFLLFIPLCSFLVFAQGQAEFKMADKPFRPVVEIDQVLSRQTNECIIKRGLTKEEGQFLYWTNYMRKNPSAFYRNCIAMFVKEFPEVDGPEAKSLGKDLLFLSPLPVFTPNSSLMDASADHAYDLATNMERISHTGSDGSDFASRVRYVGFNKCAAENIYTGKDDALIALMMLLLDIGVDSLGHRKNLLNPAFTEIGVSIKYKKGEQKVVLVQDFGCK
jgi:hypothetical protein